MTQDSWLNDRADLQAFANIFDPSIRLVSKSNWFMKAIGWVLFVITYVFTFGYSLFNREDFEKLFATTICNYMFFPEGWTRDAVRMTIPHEAGHVKQFRKFGLGIHPLVGFIPMMLLYVFLPIPIGLAYFRFYFEVEAEVHALEYHLRYDRWTVETALDRANHFAGVLASRDYFWPWPKKWVKDKIVTRVFEVQAIINKEKSANG